MLCSVCHKNMAVIFTKKIDGNNNSEMEGYCYDCAKKKGINPLDVLAKQSGITEEQIDNISKQFETMLGEITEDISPEDLENIEGESANLGSIFSNILGGKDTELSKESEQKSNTKVKTKKKQK